MTTVAFVQASLLIGGAERLIQSLMTRMDPERIRAIAINLYDAGPIGEQLRDAGFTVHTHLAQGKLDPFTGIRLRRVLQKEGAQAIYLMDSALPLYWAGWVRRRPHAPALVVGFHSTGKPGDHRQHAIAAKCAFPVTDRFIALADTHRRFLVNEHGLEENRFDTILNGVDVQRFHPTQDKAEAKRALGWDPEARYVGIVAALRPEKNHPLFMEAAKRLADERTKFLIVGAGPDAEALRAKAAELASPVEFLGSRNDTDALYRALDVAVLCSYPVVETLPVTLLEASASGTPIVSTDVGSIRDIVVEGETGFLTPSGELEPLTDAIRRLLDDAGQRAAMGAAARRRAEALFKIETMAAAYERLFEDVARMKGVSR